MHRLPRDHVAGAQLEPEGGVLTQHGPAGILDKPGAQVKVVIVTASWNCCENLVRSHVTSMLFFFLSCYSVCMRERGATLTASCHIVIFFL